MIFAMTPLERRGRMPRPSTSHLDVKTQILDSESVAGVVLRSKLPCLKPPCKGVMRPCRTNQASRCRASPFLLRPRFARRMSDSYVILGNFVTLWEASRAFPWQRTMTSSCSADTSRPTLCATNSWNVLSNVGNLSSATILFILQEWLEKKPLNAGDYALAAAFGPGFSAEFLLLQWA